MFYAALMYQSIPKPPILPGQSPGNPRAIPGHLIRVKLLTVGNLTQNEAYPVGHLTFCPLSEHYIVISWNAPLFKVLSEDKLNKNFCSG